MSIVLSDWFSCGPNIVGATGGSGTRVIGQIMAGAGMYIGTVCNRAGDANDLRLFCRRWTNPYLAHRDGLLWPLVRATMRRDLTMKLRRHLARLDEPQPWGWKNPRSIFLLPFLHEQFPMLRFVHVVRDGRDMAFSRNQNQVLRHGKALLGRMPREWPLPARSVALWGRINTITADYGREHLGSRYLLLRFEDLCAEPESMVQRILSFLGLEGDVQQLAGLVVAPKTLGRWKEQSADTIAQLHEISGVALERFGYDLSA